MLNTDLALREDLREACISEWTRLAEPGNWWTATDRIAIAGEARAATSCRLCAERKASISPALTGSHDGSGSLEESIVDIVHRVRTDAARLSRDWLGGVLTQLSSGEYVELVGVVVTETFVDSLALALGSPLPRLPGPRPGDPSRAPAPTAVIHSAWVPTVRPEDASGVVADVYGVSAYKVVSNVIRSLSLVPSELMGQKVRGGATYRSPHLVLSKDQVELLATATSSANDCFY